MNLILKANQKIKIILRIQIQLKIKLKSLHQKNQIVKWIQIKLMKLRMMISLK